MGEATPVRPPLRIPNAPAVARAPPHRLQTELGTRERDSRACPRLWRVARRDHPNPPEDAVAPVALPEEPEEPGDPDRRGHGVQVDELAGREGERVHVLPDRLIQS